VENGQIYDNASLLILIQNTCWWHPAWHTAEKLVWLFRQCRRRLQCCSCGEKSRRVRPRGTRWRRRSAKTVGSADAGTVAGLHSTQRRANFWSFWRLQAGDLKWKKSWRKKVKAKFV